MKKLLIPLLLLLPLHAYAENNIYVEGQLNYNNPKDVSTKERNGVVGSAIGDITYTDVKLKNKYDSETDAGIEIGLANIADTNFRLGLSYTKTSFKLDKSTLSGSLEVGGETISGGEDISPSTWASVGLTFDNDVKLYMANAYYDFEIDQNFKPFIGLGMGMADIENAKDNREFTYSGTVGARYFFNEKVYLGGKFAYSVINGPEDQFGIEYDDIDIYTTSLILGYEF